MKCSICQADMTYFARDQSEHAESYWWRNYPDLNFCRACWDGLDDLQDHLTRLTIAKHLRQFRQTDRAMARRFWNSLRGCGIPPNMKRLHKRRMTK